MYISELELNDLKQSFYYPVRKEREIVIWVSAEGAERIREAIAEEIKRLRLLYED